MTPNSRRIITVIRGDPKAGRSAASSLRRRRIAWLFGSALGRQYLLVSDRPASRQARRTLMSCCLITA
jgi:hypothetical protein